MGCCYNALHFHPAALHQFAYQMASIRSLSLILLRRVTWYISIIECSFRLSTKDNILWRKVQSCVVFHFFNVYFKLREDEKKNILILVSFIFSVHKKPWNEKKSFTEFHVKNVLKSCTNLNMYFCISIYF